MGDVTLIKPKWINAKSQQKISIFFSITGGTPVFSFREPYRAFGTSYGPPPVFRRTPETNVTDTAL